MTWPVSVVKYFLTLCLSLKTFKEINFEGLAFSTAIHKDQKDSHFHYDVRNKNILKIVNLYVSM